MSRLSGGHPAVPTDVGRRVWRPSERPRGDDTCEQVLSQAVTAPHDRHMDGGGWERLGLGREFAPPSGTMVSMSMMSPDGSTGPRLSDADRDRVVEVLKRSCGDGRLTLDDFSERVGAAYQAVSLGDIPPLLGDIPHPFGPDFAGVLGGEIDHLSAPVTPPVPDAAIDHKTTRWTVSIMGGSQRRGRWRLREKTNAIAIMGGCHLDMRRAEVEGPIVNINAIAIMGGIDIIVPEGIDVELGGIAIMGGKDAGRMKDVPRIPGSPIVRVKAFAFWGSVTVRNKPAHPP